ncbi:MAG: exodeoxyribonuclease VII large subunit, partial [Verrucomicrobiota bacterium]
LRHRFAQTRSHLERRLENILERWKSRLSFISRSVLFREPARRVGELAQRLDLTQEALGREIRARLDRQKQQVDKLLGVIRQHRPDQVIRLKQNELAGVALKLNETALASLSACRHRLQRVENVLRVLGPQATLERGYSITTTESGEVIRSVQETVPQLRVVTQLRDGKFSSEIC